MIKLPMFSCTEGPFWMACCVQFPLHINLPCILCSQIVCGQTWNEGVAHIPLNTRSAISFDHLWSNHQVCSLAWLLCIVNITWVDRRESMTQTHEEFSRRILVVKQPQLVLMSYKIKWHEGNAWCQSRSGSWVCPFPFIINVRFGHLRPGSFVFGFCPELHREGAPHTPLKII